MNKEPEALVPDPVAQREFGVTPMTWWRWSRDEKMIALGFPPPVKIRNRNYRGRRRLEKFKRNLLSGARVA